ncbi:MAG: hypothetical protein RLZZ550_1687 [Verrucomicrobiota bacterium]|jgi:hypothetical protein
MRFTLPSFCLLALGFVPSLAFAALTNGKLQVGIVKDEAYLYDKQGKKEPLKTARIFQEGFRVETTPKNTVELILSNGSTLIVSPDTLLEVKTFRQVVSDRIVEGEYQKLDKEPSPSITEIEVIRGKVVGEVRKLNPQSSYTIKTPVGVARIRGTIYTVEFADNGKGTGTLNIGCVRGSVEATVFAANSGPIAVKPGDQLSVQAPVPKPVEAVKPPDATGTKPADATGTKPADATGTPEPAPAPAPAPVISLAPMNSEQLGSVATTLATVSSLDQGVAATVKNMADNAPPPPPPVAPVTTTNPDGTTTTTTPAAEVPPSKPLTPPTQPTNTSTGGGTSSTDATLQKITDTVQRTVQTETQTNPSPTGG